MEILRILQIPIALCLVFAFEDILQVNSLNSNEMLEQGKMQYQLLQERGSLPKFGLCWKQAVEHIDEGCRHLSEETQGEIALYLTNCFLEMSGHATYSCELNKKPNVRAICINSMSDRAFNVYTEFYSHTQNMCWFLRGQIWHETIAENTQKVGKQLEDSARNQKDLLVGQKESLELQKRLIDYGRDLEDIMGTFLNSAKKHEELLLVMSGSLNGLQSWLFGEVSWWDSIIFYLAALIFVAIFTSSKRTASAKLPMFALLGGSFTLERSCLKYFIGSFGDMLQTQSDYHLCIWYFRYVYMGLSVFMLIFTVYHFKDYALENNCLLVKLDRNMLRLMECVSNEHRLNNQVIQTKVSSDKFLNYRSEDALSAVSEYLDKFSNRTIKTNSFSQSELNYTNKLSNSTSSGKPKSLVEIKRYNLRTRPGTPEGP